MGERALYFAAFLCTEYLPYQAVQRAWIQSSSLPLTGCCGKELPVSVLRIRYEGGFYRSVTFEKRENAERVLEKLKAACPNLPTEPETP
jgi:hypothetical protein